MKVSNNSMFTHICLWGKKRQILVTFSVIYGVLLILYYYSEIMNLHSFNSDAAPRPKGIPDVKTGNSQLFFRLKKPVMFLGSDSLT